MKLRSAFLSAPAVAAFALLALVIGTIFGVRSAMNDSDGGDTEVAGTVIERSEPAEITEEPTVAPIDPVVVRPRPSRVPRTQAPEPVDTDPEDTDPVEPAEEPEQPVGLIPDPDGAQEPAGEEPAAGDPEPEPQPEPTRRPRPRPQPQPDPEPTPEPTPDTTRFEMRPGPGFSRDVAESWEQGNSGKFNWEIRSVAGHGQTPETEASRRTQERVSVGFNPAAFESDRSVRNFRCDALVTAGSRRLITDDNTHAFEIALWTTDGYQLGEQVDAVLVRAALDLAPGEQRTLEGNTYTLDAAEGIHYTCQVRYISL